MVKVLVRRGKRPRCFGPSCGLGRGSAAGELVEPHGSGRTGSPTDPYDRPPGRTRRVIVLPWERHRCPRCRRNRRERPAGGSRTRRRDGRPAWSARRPFGGPKWSTPETSARLSAAITRDRRRSRSLPPASDHLVLRRQSSSLACLGLVRTELTVSQQPTGQPVELVTRLVPAVHHGSGWPSARASHQRRSIPMYRSRSTFRGSLPGAHQLLGLRDFEGCTSASADPDRRDCGEEDKSSNDCRNQCGRSAPRRVGVSGGAGWAGDYGRRLTEHSKGRAPPQIVLDGNKGGAAERNVARHRHHCGELIAVPVRAWRHRDLGQQRATGEVDADRVLAAGRPADLDLLSRTGLRWRYLKRAGFSAWNTCPGDRGDEQPAGCTDRRDNGGSANS